MSRPVSRREASPFQAPARGPLLQRISPVAADLRAYQPGTLPRDLLAGLTIAALRPDAADLQNVGLLDAIGEGHIYPTVRAAVQAACPKREGA